MSAFLIRKSTRQGVDHFDYDFGSPMSTASSFSPPSSPPVPSRPLGPLLLPVASTGVPVIGETLPDVESDSDPLFSRR